MSHTSSAISLSEIKGRILSNLDDLQAEGIMTKPTYARKSQDRIIYLSIMEADREVCLEEQLSGTVSIFVPANRTTIFFGQQSDYLSNFVDEHGDVKTSDKTQFSYLIGQKQFLDIVSVRSNQAYVFSSIPLEGEVASERLWHGTKNQSRRAPTRKYQLTSGTVVEEPATSRKYFYVEPAHRKMILSEPFGENKWLLFDAQIAPTSDISEMSDGELENYRIRSPFYAKKLLVSKAMIDLLPASVASTAGYFDLENKGRQDSSRQKPGTGNVIISGDELDSGMFDDL